MKIQKALRVGLIKKINVHGTKSMKREIIVAILSPLIVAAILGIVGFLAKGPLVQALGGVTLSEFSKANESLKKREQDNYKAVRKDIGEIDNNTNRH